MEPHAGQTCSFILKVWVEEHDEEHSRTLWRGHITHVMSGKRHYFENLSAALNFMLPYFETIGIQIESSDIPGIV